MPGSTNSDIFSIIKLWKCGWNLYKEPSIPTVTRGSLILFKIVAIPADAKCAARLDMHSQIYRTLIKSCSVACFMPKI